MSPLFFFWGSGGARPPFYIIHSKDFNNSGNMLDKSPWPVCFLGTFGGMYLVMGLA